MKRITQRSAVFTAAMLLTVASVAMGAPKSDSAGKYLTISGRVLQINQQARTLLVEDKWSDKLYLVSVPKSETFKITFGLNMNVTEPELWHARRNDRVRIRCVRTTENLAQLEDGRHVVLMSAAH